MTTKVSSSVLSTTGVTAATYGSSTGTTPVIAVDAQGRITSASSATTNISGGAAGQVLYQSGTNATSNTDVGTAGYLLTSQGASKPTWSAQSSLSIGSSQVTGTLAATQLSNTIVYGVKTNTSALQGTISATQVANSQTYGINISGSAGSATSATSATNATNATNLVTTNFTITESGGNLIIKYGATTIVTISSTGSITVNT